MNGGMEQLIEQARWFAGLHDGHDTDCIKCFVAVLADAIEQRGHRES